MGLAVALLIVTCLFLKSLQRLQADHPGFAAEKLLALRLNLPATRYPDRAAVVSLIDKVSARLGTLPGARQAEAVSALPMGGVNPTVDFTVVGRPPASPEEVPTSRYRMITPGFLAALEVPLLQGRAFTDQDHERSLPVALVNQSLARQFFPDGDVIGSHLTIDDGDPPPREIEIVGVVGDVRHMGRDELRVQGAEGQPSYDVYVPYRQIPEAIVYWARNNMFWVVRAEAAPETLMLAARREVQGIDADIAAAGVMVMEQLLARTLAPRRFNALLLGLFACAALLLAASGLYSVTSYSVARRTPELGLRVALGARKGDILRLVLGQGLKPVAAGAAAGVLVALAVSRVLSALLFEVRAADPVVLTAVPGLLGLVALAATCLPALRASRVDPLTALRAE